MTDELKLWRGDFGNQYHDRNIMDDNTLQTRQGLWANKFTMMMGSPGARLPKSILEVGAGLGTNLQAIKNIYDHNATDVALSAVEPNTKAQASLKSLGMNVIEKDAFNITAPDAYFDMVFTSGVLIHIDPKELKDAMAEIYRVSNKYIACIEYFSPELREANYRGHKALWTQDFGGLWIDNFSLRVITYTFYWKRTTGLDNLTGWLFEKVH